MMERFSGSSQEFFVGGAYLKNRDQIINIGMIGHATEFRRHKDSRRVRGHAPGCSKRC